MLDQETQRDANEMGRKVAVAGDWRGSYIFTVAYAAFEDANFHRFNAEFEALAKKHGLV